MSSSLIATRCDTDPNILDVFIPRVRHTFETKKEAYEFYCDYARLAGFSVRVKRTSKETADWIEKTSKRVGCPAYAKVKQDKKANQWYFDHVEEAHNHKLHQSPRMVRNAEQAREEKDADLEKLFQFFRECKTSNEYFYFDVDFDPKTKKNMTLGIFVGANNNLKNEKRKSWIATYFKGMYCGIKTSTQRSESQNRVLKDGYVNNTTTLHTFAKRAEVVRACKSRFDEQLSRVYTRAMYQEYKREYANSTAFLIEPNPDPEVMNGYLVRHEKGAGSFCWAQYAFKVVADKEAGVYECECKQWEHTGLFCMHIIRAFTHLQVQSIPKNAAIMETNENQAKINLDPYKLPCWYITG
ncbi:protein FAR1-RELATED SEQUENCE 1-like [Miscanthus floridulus]|uniref:protein FAR1-RELATED SEQUENCE 1-like n=1 Tax=Miscanthus floridulus TaxID=154761 RepID=UPI003457B186